MKAEATGYSLANFAYALLDTKLVLASARGDQAESERLWQAVRSTADGVASWYVLRSAHTRVRTLIAEQRHAEALEVAKHSLSEAIRLKNGFFKSVFSLSIAELEVATGARPSRLAELSVPSNSLSLLAVRRQVVAAALVQERPRRAATETAAARRILRAAGSEQEWYPGHGDRFIHGEGIPTSEDITLDDAVALIELAGYPHVVARDAYALLQLTG